MRVLILTHHYPPEVGAPQTRLSGTAAFLRARGHYVRVLTALPSYPTGIVPPTHRRAGLFQSEWIDGVRVERTWTYARPGASARVRLANQLSFAASALLALPRLGRPEVILVESPPLFLGATGALLGRALGAPTVLHVSDLWPEVAIQLGALSNAALIRAARLFERGVYRASGRLIVVTRTWVEQLIRQGVPREKIDLVTNGVDAEWLDPALARAERRRLRSAWSLDDKVVAACVGTLSTVYDYELLLEAAGRLAVRRELHVLIVGDGSRKDWLQQEVARRGLRNVTLLPARPHHEIRGVLAAADIAALALVPLPVTEGQLPVRLLEAMAMELPIVFAGAGVASQLVAESACGMAVRPGDVDGFTRILDWLVDDPDLRQRLGRAGRQTIALRFSRRAVAAKIERALLAAVERQP